MDIFETIKKFLAEGGKCLIIEDGKPVGVVLTMEEYEKLQHLPIQHLPLKEFKTPEEIKSEKIASNISAPKPFIFEPVENFNTELADIGLNDEVTLEDLGLDELQSY